MRVISSNMCPSVHLKYIKIGDSLISPSEPVRNLGVIMESNYTMVSYINHTVQDSFLNMTLYYYRRYLDRWVIQNFSWFSCHKAKRYEHICTADRQENEIWSCNSSTSRSPLPTCRTILQIQNFTFGIWMVVVALQCRGLASRISLRHYYF